MKSYRNEQLGFEITIPDDWSLSGVTNHSIAIGRMIIFKCRNDEAFNIRISHLKQNLLAYQIENEFRQYAQEKGYTSLALGRFNADEEEHVWARYYLGYRQWAKKYRIVLHGFEYLITATCLDQKELLKMEKVWDEVATSFCLIKDNVDAKNEILEQKREIQGGTEIGNGAKNEISSKDNIEGVKTYRNEKVGFEIVVPGGWTFPSTDPLLTPSGAEITFGCGTNEAFYITAKESKAKLSTEQIKLRFREYASEKGYSNLEFGKFELADDEFVCVAYCMGDNVWVKKYLVFMNNINYEITASCTDQSSNRNTFNKKCKDWDLIVRLFRILHPPTDEVFRRETMGWFDVQPVTDTITIDRRNDSPKAMAGMKTYRNERHGFEIDIPESWSPAPGIVYGLTKIITGSVAEKMGKDVFQYGCYDEAFNFEIGPLFPEPLLEDTEVEFRLYARDRGFTNLHFGRVMVAGKDHVCASYFINDNMGKRWNKKYMIVFGGVEYTLTGTCNDPQFFVTREKAWDSIIQTFRLLKPVDDSVNLTGKADRYREKRREIIDERIDMRNALGDLYAKAYEAVSLGNYKEARSLLEKCLQENPNHVLAHKELAVVLERLSDIKGAIRHREEVKRLAPDDMVNRSKLDKLLAGSGRNSYALQDVRKALKITPRHPVLLEVEKKLTKSRVPNYRMIFISSLICLLLTDISFFFPEYIVIRDVGCMSLLMLIPTWGVWVSGPWVGIPRKFSSLIAGILYIFFLIHVW